MKKAIFLVLLLAIMPIVISQEIYTAKNVVIDLSINSELQLVPRSDNYKIDYVIANLSFFPRDGFNQDVVSLTTNPNAQSIDESIMFRWDNPFIGNLMFGLNSRVMTNDNRVRVMRKVRFPIQMLPNSAIPYTEPSETIDSDNFEIIKLASELAAGEDDLYAVAHNIATWVKNNVHYELSSLTEGVSQKASWVLKTKEGVCDEITNLFIALLRSLGVPAKFISGMSYTELIETGWGNHGWAEVYFPGYGWVPFDVTYGEFGYLDPTHIKLNEALDAEAASTRYQWYGRDVDVITKSLDTSAEVKEMLGRTQPPLRMNVIAVKDEIGFGSHNLVEATVENLDDSYYSTELHLSKPLEVSILCCEDKRVLLEPNERKKVYWKIKIPESLRKTSVYTFPLVVWTTKNFTAQTSFKASLLSKEYSLSDINQMLSQRQQEESKVYSKNVEFSCQISKEEFYLEDTAFVVCSIRNTGNVMLEDVKVCGDDNCETFDLGITQAVSKDFIISTSSVGAAEFIVKAESLDISKTEYIKYTVLDRPIISINNLDYPYSVPYGNEFSISFSLNKMSLSFPKDVIIELHRNGVPIRRRVHIEELLGTQPLKLNLKSTDLGLNQNNFDLRISYKDDAGNEYLENKVFSIMLTDVPASQVPLVAIKSVLMKLENVDIKSLVLMLSIVALIFVIIVVYITRDLIKNR
jgi:hypothetical protein